MTHRWSLRETDLWNYSLSLQEIDNMRIEGKFVDAEGNRPDGQYVGVVTSSPASLRADCVLGPLIPAETMLRPHIPPAIFQ